MKERIKTYLASGLKPAQICSIVGCSPAYISQLWADEKFRAETEALMADSGDKVDEKLDIKYESAEHQILDAMQDAITGASFSELSRGLETIAKVRDMKANRKNPIVQPGGGNNFTLVQLTLPAHAIPAQPNVVLNAQSEIIAINDKPLAPLSADGVKSLFQTMKEKKQAAGQPVMEL